MTDFNKSFSLILTEKLDNMVVRALVTLLILLPATLFINFFGYKYFMHGLYLLPKDISIQDVILFIPRVAIPVLGALGIAGAWIRMRYSHTQISDKLRNITIGLLICGIVAGIYSIGLATGSNRYYSVILYFIYSLEGALLIMATPRLNSVALEKINP